MTLPEQPHFFTTEKVIGNILYYYVGIDSYLSTWSREMEHKLIFGNQKPFCKIQALKNICAEHHLQVNFELKPVLRGTHLTVEITLL